MNRTPLTCTLLTCFATSSSKCALSSGVSSSSLWVSVVEEGVGLLCFGCKGGAWQRRGGEREYSHSAEKLLNSGPYETHSSCIECQTVHSMNPFYIKGSQANCYTAKGKSSTLYVHILHYVMYIHVEITHTMRGRSDHAQKCPYPVHS